MRRSRPMYLLTITATVIFLAEGLVMLLLHLESSRLRALPPWVEGLLDASLLTLIVFPVLYGTLLRPMRQEVARRAEAEGRLETAHDELEAQVRERTRQLGRANESLRAVMETAHDAVISADSRGQVTHWNKQAAAMFGYAAEEVVGRSLTLIMPERFRQAHANGVQRLVTGGAPHVVGKMVEFVGLRKDGLEFPLELSLAAWAVDGQQFFTAIIRDISARKQAEEALKENNRQLASMNNLMLNREERIMEMKTEVNALLQELGRPSRYQA